MNWKALVCSLLVALPAFADDFKAANVLYDAGKFAEAATAYEKIEPKTAHVYFNLGNALFRQEKYGPALLNYERAWQIAPRDPDILANLRFAESRAGVEEVNTAHKAWQRFVRRCVESRTLAEWLTLELAAMWIAAVAAGAGVWLRKGRGPLLGGAIVCGLILIATISAMIYRVVDERTAPKAIILVNQTEARFAPLTDSTVHFVLGEGTKVSVKEGRGEWLLVERADGQQGWVRRETLEQIRLGGV